MKSDSKRKAVIACYVLGGIVIGVVFTGALFFSAPAVIRWLFSRNEFWETWNKEDLLSYWGSVLSFAGTVALGIITVFQTRKAHEQTERANQLAQDALTQTETANKLTAQMQKLEQANFVSMVSVSNLQIKKRRVEQPNFINIDMPDRENIDLTADGFESAYCYHIDIMFENGSDYPIVQIDSQAGMRGNMSFHIFGMDKKSCAIYIPPHGSQAVRYIVPRKMFEMNETYKLSLSVDLINIFDYATRATIHIMDLEPQNGKLQYSFRLAKYIDVRPQ